MSNKAQMWTTNDPIVYKYHLPKPTGRHIALCGTALGCIFMRTLPDDSVALNQRCKICTRIITNREKDLR